MVPKCFTTPRELGQAMIYKGNNLKFALTDLECKIMNLGPKKSGGIFKNIYNKIILLSFLTVFIIFSVVAYVLWSY